mgnify:CR=1 FL=1
MEKQLIISLGREFGSGGHIIAQQLAERYKIPLYDSNLLRHVAVEKEMNAEKLQKYDENPKNVLFTRTVRGYSSSPEENIARMQFDYLKSKADAGESFVIVGRCAESVLKGNPNLISIFILGDMEQKIVRTMESNNISKEKAVMLIEQQDKKRKTYHNHYCEGKWGDSRNYDLSINSSKLGLDETTRIIAEYIDSRRK